MLVPGSASVSIKEWMLPTLGSAPHDAVDAPDGSFWWTGKSADMLGRLDPKTGVIREYTLPNAASRPRRLAFGSDDLIWHSDYARGYLGRLNPTTGEVKEWPSPGGPQSQP